MAPDEQPAKMAGYPWPEEMGALLLPRKPRPAGRLFPAFPVRSPDGFGRLPPVRIEIRDRHGVQQERAEQEWPPARTAYRELFLDPARGTLCDAAPPPSSLRQDAIHGEAHFTVRFDRPTEITGHAALRLWVEAEGSDDADLFIALQKLDADGQEVGFTFTPFMKPAPLRWAGKGPAIANWTRRFPRRNARCTATAARKG
jgi:hypothetical protein